MWVTDLFHRHFHALHVHRIRDVRDLDDLHSSGRAMTEQRSRDARVRRQRRTSASGIR